MLHQDMNELCKREMKEEENNNNNTDSPSKRVEIKKFKQNIFVISCTLSTSNIHMYVFLIRNLRVGCFSNFKCTNTNMFNKHYE